MGSGIPWYADCARCRPYLDAVGLSDQKYLAGIDEVQGVMSPEEARREVARMFAERVPFDPPSLHPFPGQRLTHHPLPFLLWTDCPASNVWTDLTRFGLDLLATRSLDRIASKKRVLLNFEQYRATMFEIEVFAELARAGMTPVIGKETPDCTAQVNGELIDVEVKLGEAKFGASVFYAIPMGWLFFREGDWGVFHIHLEPGVGGDGETVTDVAKLINADMQQLLEGFSESSIVRTGSRIDYDPTNKTRTLEVRFGNEGTYTDMLETHVMSWLREKEEKLLKLERGGRPALIALDLRSMVWALPRPGGRFAGDEITQGMVRRRGIEEHREALVRGIRTFLRGAKAVTGVLAWWRKFEPELSLRERCMRPWEISLTTRHAHESVSDAQSLAPLCGERLRDG